MSTLLALLGIPVVLLLGAAMAGIGARHRSARADGAFRCKLRILRGRRPGIRRRWPYQATHAAWVHDVLLVHRGLLRPRVLAMPVKFPDDAIYQVSALEISGLGASPLVISLQLDDGDLVEVAAAESARTLLAGPFLAAAIPGLPNARTERP